MNDAPPEIAVLDVGQGLCVVVADKRAKAAAVIDCPTGRSQATLDHLGLLEITTVEAVVMSHLDADHYGGLAGIIEQVTLTKLWLASAKDFAKEHPRLRSTFKQLNALRKTKAFHSYLVERAKGFSFGDIDVAFLAPSGDDWLDAQDAGDANAASAIIQVRAGELTALIGSDAPPSRWAALADRQTLRSDLLVFPHHGGAFSESGASYTVEDLLEAVSPSVVAVSVGSANRYQHPHPQVLADIRGWVIKNNARLVCTQLNDICRIAAAKAGAGTPNTPCAGTIRVSRSGGVLGVEPSLAAHATTVDAAADPHCRPPA